jgi:membrane protein
VAGGTLKLASGPRWVANLRSLLLRLPFPTDLWRALALFWRHNAMGMAAMIAFFGFLSLVPLVILLLAFLGNLMGGLISARDVQHLFHGVVPGLSRYQFLHTYWDPVRHSKVATTILGAVSLLLGTLGLHDSVDWAVNRLWESHRTRPFWVMKLRGIAIIVWVVGFGVFSLWLTSLLAIVAGTVHAPNLTGTGWAALVPSVFIDVAVFTALYKLTPTVDVKAGAALAAGLGGAALWEASKLAFGWWVIQVGTYNRVYGPLAASIIVMLWVWVSAMIFLYGAALSVVIQRRRMPQEQRQRRSIVV